MTLPKEGYADYHIAGVSDDADGVTHPAYDNGIDFIRRHAGGGNGQKPFCCFVSTIEPHDPYVAPKSCFDLYDPEAIPLPASFSDELGNKPEVLRRMKGVWRDLTESQWRTIRASYWAVITFLDREIGRLIDVLKETGQYATTRSSSSRATTATCSGPTAC